LAAQEVEDFANVRDTSDRSILRLAYYGNCALCSFGFAVLHWGGDAQLHFWDAATLGRYGDDSGSTLYCVQFVSVKGSEVDMSLSKN
jgi:hypothetical protein